MAIDLRDVVAADTARAERGPLWRRLWVQVLAAVILGAALGILSPGTGGMLKPLSDAFVKAIRMIIGPVVFLTVVVGIARMGDLKRLAGIGLASLAYFEMVSTLALISSLIVGNLFPTGAGIDANPASLDVGAVSEYLSKAHQPGFVAFLLDIIPSSFGGAFVGGDILPILFLAILVGVALCRMGDRARRLIDLADLAVHGLFEAVRVIMIFAPIAAFGAIAFTIAKFGLPTLLGLGRLVAAVYLLSIVFVVVVLGLALRLSGLRLWPVLSYFKDEILFVFFATSFETMLPRTMQKLEHLGVRKEAVGVIVPTGFTFNMDGTAIYMGLAVLFIAQATNTPLPWAQQLAILFVMLFTSKGTAGVTGGGFIALAATLPAVHVLPVGGLALLIGVDRFMAQIRAAVNLASNAIAALVIARWVGALDVARARRVLAAADDPADNADDRSLMAG